MRGALARLVFPARHVTCVGLGLAAAIVPGLEHRWLLVALVYGVLLPVDVAFGVWTRRHGRFPVLMPVFIQFLAAAVVLILPGVFAAAMVALLADNALTSVALGRRVALRVGLLGIGLVGAAAVVAGVPNAAMILAVLAVETATVAVILGTLAAHELRLRERYGTLVDEVDVIVWEIVPGSNQFSYVSPGAERLLGYPLERWYEQGFWTDHLHPDDAEETGRACDEAFAAGRDHVLEYRMIAADGREVHLRDVATVEVDAVGKTTSARGVIMDVTDRRRAELALRQQATHDPLTALPNRAMFADRIDRALRESVRTGDPVALLLLDLDDFKEINDALGHKAGDRLLQAFALRLQDELRDCDTVARLGGDEFAVLLTVAADEYGATAVAQRILGCLDEPFIVDGVELHARSSIGIAVYPEHASDAATLTTRADVAMYVAKRSGRGVAIYAPELDQSSVERLTLLNELRRAIAGDELFLEHQPCFDLRSGAVTGYEALVRWQHPERGRIPPQEFIHLSEVSGLIESLSRWVLTRAIDDHVAAGLDVQLSVNLSARNLAEPDLVHWITELLTSRSFPPARLTLELTESEVIGDVAATIDALRQLRELGVRISIDDFGTGQSTLAYLKDLPIDELKIDQAFVRDIGSSASDTAICRTIVDLAHLLGLRVVAEGVQDDEAMTVLRGLGCDRAQGFHLGLPVAAGELASDAARAAVPM